MKEIGQLTFDGKLLSIQVGRYSINRALAVELVDAETGVPFATVSENHLGLDLRENEFVAQTRNWRVELSTALLASGKFEHTGRTHTFGPHSTVEPIWRLVPDGEMVW
jgi:hypothetical protein